jgi:hypothetical protein
LLAGICTGCWAQGLTFDYRAARATLELSPKDDGIAVAVQDRRPYVLSGSRPESFVGIRRGVYGIPIDLGTTSGQPLSGDIAVALAQSLKFNRIEATPVAVPPKASKDQAFKAVLDAGKARAVLLTIDEWRTDSMVNTDVHYGLRVEVIDRTARVRGLNEVFGKDQLGGNANGPQVLAKKLEDLFNRQVTAALEGAAPAPAAATDILSQPVQCKVGADEPKTMTRIACSQSDGVIVGR